VDAYSFRVERLSSRDQNLIYEEPGFKLVVSLETSGVRDFDLVGCDSSFETWTEPSGVAIEASRRQQLLDRVTAWGAQRKLRIGIGPCIDKETFFRQAEHDGYRLERREDGSVVMHPPPRKPLWVRLKKLFGGA
jgi:hypothetical protein